MTKGWLALSKKAIDRFRNPQNVGKIENPDGIGPVGDSSWGIDLELYIKVKEGIITSARFKAFGCAATIATISMVSEMLEGKNIKHALAISNDEIAAALDGLPPSKMYCAELGRELIKSAIDDFTRRNIQK